MRANADKMQNDRVLGSITLSKVDLDAARYLAAGSNGDTTLEGAVYDLYAADTIEHPDGVSGVVDYSKITDANGTPIWHTTVLTNGGWDTDYLPILQKDRLVASAKITDGKLAFANLYMGRYYLVERATGLVLPIDGNGKLHITGKYPQLNKKLERTGKYANLAVDSGEYKDYIYKNQYSAVSESRKLDGSKAWDGYYLSYAKGYLCDEVNHYETLSYADESTYHIHTEQESQDEVLKSGFSLQKLVSTTGQPSPALKLEGAGFTVYRISKLSKAAQFKQNPDGSYDAQSILDAYRKDNYDNATLKYDFTAEGQAIANMYESSTETVNAYNATLTADGYCANGKGNGWMPTDQPTEYRLGEMFTNDEGVFRVEGLPYGQYLVVETTIPKDVFQCDPFIVTVDANSPQSRFTVPAGCVTTATNNYMTYNVLDEELEGYLQLIKTDTETGKAVKIANTALAAKFTGEVADQLNGILHQIEVGESLTPQLQAQLEQNQQEFDHLLEMSLDFDENTPFLDDKLKRLSDKIKQLKTAITQSSVNSQTPSTPTNPITAKDLLITEYDDMLTARIIEKIIVKSRQDLEIIFIGGYTQQISLQ